MKQLVIFTTILLFVCITCIGCMNASEKQTASNTIVEEDSLKSDIPQGAQILMQAYPKAGLTYRDNRIYFPSGKSVVYDDGKNKSFIEKLDGADIEDMFTVPYDTISVPAYLADGGRCRCDDFLLAMYGSSNQEVTSNLVTVNWLGQQLRVSKVNGVNKQVEAVAKELSKYPELKEYTENSSSFNWRYVRGSNTRLSAHSYGVTIDVNTQLSDYWLWSNGMNTSETAKIKYENRISRKVVEIFQKYGFIWGGYWYHFDTMHFEYRPEILINRGINPIIIDK